MEILKREFREVAEVTVDSSAFAVEPYQKMGFVVSGAREAERGVIWIPMTKRIREDV